VKEQCPDNLVDMKQPSIFKTQHQKPHPIDSDEDKIYPFQKKSTDGPDDIELSDGGGSIVPDQDSLTPFSNTKHSSDIYHKKPSNKDHRSHPSDRPKKKDHLGHPQGKNKDSTYNSFDPFSQPGKSDEMDDLDYLLDGFGPPQSSQFPKGHRPKRPYQLTKRPDKSDNGPSDETDDLDYPNGSPTFVSQFPTSLPTKRPKKSKFGSRPDNSDQYGSDKLDGWNPDDSNKNPSLTDGPVKAGPPNRPKRPGRSPYSGSPDQNGYAYPNETDMPDSSDESSGKRVPRRGDIGIQSLDERGG